MAIMKPSGGTLYTATVTTPGDTKFRMMTRNDAGPSFWSLSSTAFSSDIDDADAIIDANIDGDEVKVGDFFFSATNTGGVVSSGVFVVRSMVVSGGRVTGLDLSNISSFGLANSN